MIIDFNDSNAPAFVRSKICIVGCGVIGLTLVSEFLNSPHTDVLILDSGGETENKRLDASLQVINTGDVESGVQGSMARVFGGAGTLWGGQALPFSETDFQEKSWVSHSGWPFKLETLKKYYQRASSVLNLEDSDFDRDIWGNNKSVKNELDANLLKLSYSKWSPKPDLSQIYKRPIQKSRHVKALINANVTEIIPHESENAVKKLKIKSLSGKHGEVTAQMFILCCGGIDNARLLLASNKQDKQGLGNRHGNVGRYYQDHIGFYGARLVPSDFSAFVNLFSNVLDGRQKYLPKLDLSRRRQMSDGLLNVNGNISIQPAGDSMINHIKKFYQSLSSHGLNRQSIRYLINAAKSPAELLRILDSYYIKQRKYFPRDAEFFLIANCESEPVAQSTITLSTDKDLFGMPLARIDWKITDLSRRSMLHYYEAVQSELKRLEIAETKIKPALYEQGETWKQHCYSLFHHMGATRMSQDPKLGVVDSNCKVHGIDNLYIAGSSVFPTSSASNPTFTAMALAIRLADKIKQNIGH